MIIDSRIKKLAVGTTAFFLLIVATLLNAQQMYLMAVVVIVIPIISWLLGYWFATGLDCIRVMPQTCSVHERVKVRIHVRNPGFALRFFLRICDRLPRWLRFAGSDNPQGPLILNLWPGAEREITYYIEPIKRGLYRVGPMRVLSADPLGFSNYRKALPIYAELVVYPQVLPVFPGFLEAGGGHGWQDQDCALSRGGGTDFDGVREYRSGDELRRINWKATARTNSLAVTEYTQGYANAMLIALDTNHEAYLESGAGLDSALEYGITLAASIASAALNYGSPVSLVVSDDISMASNPIRSIEELPRVLDILSRVEATSSVRLATVLDGALRLTRPGAMLVAITPERPDDANLRKSFDDWLRPPASSSLSIMWLEKSAFQRVHQSRTRDLLARHKRSNEPPPEPIEPTHYIRSNYGREFFISPDSEMTRLLQGYSDV